MEEEGEDWRGTYVGRIGRGDWVCVVVRLFITPGIEASQAFSMWLVLQAGNDLLHPIISDVFPPPLIAEGKAKDDGRGHSRSYKQERTRLKNSKPAERQLRVTRC